jgi:hypothetical protein
MDALPFDQRMKLMKTNELILRIVDDYLIVCDDEARMDAIKHRLGTQLPTVATVINAKICSFYFFFCWTGTSLSLNDGKTIRIVWSKPRIINMHEIPDANASDDDDPDMDLDTIQIDLISNYTEKFITWNGLDINVYTLDIYLNYEKYFNTDMKTRISVIKTSSKHSYLNFNLKFLRIFNTVSSNLLLTTKINSIQAVLRNIIDFFALSAIRFVIMFKYSPQEVKENIGLQIRLVLNLSYLLNKKLNFFDKKIFQDLFLCTLSLFKFISLNVYIRIFSFKSKCCHHNLKLVFMKILDKQNFVNSIRFNKKHVCNQLITSIDKQLEKFKSCKFT